MVCARAQGHRPRIRRILEGAQLRQTVNYKKTASFFHAHKRRRRSAANNMPDIVTAWPVLAGNIRTKEPTMVQLAGVFAGNLNTVSPSIVTAHGMTIANMFIVSPALLEGALKRQLRPHPTFLLPPEMKIGLLVLLPASPRCHHARPIN